ncbi:MAG: transposase [Muribaculaceae bacterium]
MEQNDRKSIRYRRYNYANSGIYFITICAADMKCLFGKVANGVMIKNHLGIIVEEEWKKTAEVRSGSVVLHEHVVMPNHFHALVEIVNPNFGMIADKVDFVSPSMNLGSIVRGFKSSVSRRARFAVWQRNYYDHIVRRREEYHEIRKYIRNNPMNWAKDELFDENF